MKVTVREFELKLTHPFTISRKTQLEMETLIVELEDDGIVGYGETMPDSYYGQSQADIIKLDREGGVVYEGDRVSSPPPGFWGSY